MSDNIQAVQSIYHAFGQGDIPGVLARLSPQVQWEAWANFTPQRAGHPLFAARKGTDGAAAFFNLLHENTTFHEFKVLDVFGDGRQVAAEIVVELTWTPTGRRLRDEELHLWTFGEDGMVARFRHYLDTAKHMEAAGLLPA